MGFLTCSTFPLFGALLQALPQAPGAQRDAITPLGRFDFLLSARLLDLFLSFSLEGEDAQSHTTNDPHQPTSAPFILLSLLCTFFLKCATAALSCRVHPPFTSVSPGSLQFWCFQLVTALTDHAILCLGRFVVEGARRDLTICLKCI